MNNIVDNYIQNPVTEFSADMVQGLFCSFLVKQKLQDKMKIRCYWNRELPKQLWEQFCDEYIVSNESSRNRCLYNHVKSKRRSFTLGDFHKRFNLSFLDSPFCEKYVCFIPLLSERWSEKPWKGSGRSIPFEGWARLRQLANKYGHRVVVLGLVHGTGLDKTQGKLEQLGDEICLMFNKSILSTYLVKQLSIMKNALFTVGMGGGGVIAPVFGLPTISVDLNWHRTEFDRFFHMEKRDDVYALYKFPLRNGSVLTAENHKEKLTKHFDPNEVFSYTEVCVANEMVRRFEASS